jgi:tetratricopeptide (TPR) repeat protein/tRNA A-37 threonylcarbamoyl transferase component Bud32
MRGASAGVDESVLRRVDRACDRFEAAWKAGRRPRIEDDLGTASGPDRAALLRELVPLDVSYRRRLGERPTREEYHQRFPDHAAVIEAAFETVPSGPAEDARVHLARASTIADNNLLFGIMALQLDFVTREALIAAMHAWVLQKSKPLGRILVEQGALAEARHTLLEALVREHLEQHDDDPQRSLAALSPLGPVRQDLEQVADADLAISLTHVSAARTVDDPYATVVPSEGPPSSSDQRFLILRPHARGGLGVVSVAYDQELHREVALKEIQDQHADRPESRSRFLREAAITGGLEHPGIVPVYGLGQYADGRPYYAMRFIRGNSLKDEIKRFHAKGGPCHDPGERALALRKLLGRFLDVCNAIEYAHSRGVLHRDLKPGNIMVGKYGETLVVDWGLAKLLGRSDPDGASEEKPLVLGSTDESTETRPGATLGTPAYMSPEQAAGQLERLGPTSDVYSLGATLYHLLTGRIPFEESSPDGIAERVRRGDAPPSGQACPGTDTALEAICRKAMAWEPEDRYASARALADDLEHWLADEPVSAYPEPWDRRLARWTRRHRAWVQAGAAAALVITLVSVVSAVSIRRAWSAETLMEARQAQRLAALRARGEALVLAGQSAVSDRDWAKANSLLSNVIAMIGSEPELDPLEALAAPLLAQAARHQADQDALQSARETYQQFRRRSDDALFHATQFLGLDPLASRRETRAAIRDALASLGVTEDGTEAPNLSHWYLRQRANEITGGCYELLLLLAEAEAPTPADRSIEEPRAGVQRALRILDRAAALGRPTWVYHLQRANYLARLGDEPGARAERRRASGRSAGAFDHFHLGMLHHSQGDPAAALPHFERALGLRPGDFWASYHIAICLLKLGRPAEARAYLTACIGQRPDFLWSYLVRGYTLGELGEFEAAEADFHAAEGLNPDTPARYALLVNRGRTRVLGGQLEDAHADLLTAISLLPERHEAYVNRAQVYRAQKQWDEAEAQLNQAIRLAPDLAGPYRDRARLRVERGRPAAALSDLDRAIEHEASVPGQVAEDRTLRGLLLYRSGRPADALAAADAALVARPELGMAHRLRAEALTALGRDQEASDALDRSLASDAPDADAYRLRGLLRKALGRTAAAVEDFTRALEHEPNSSNMRTKRGWAYLLNGLDLALEDFDRAIAQNPSNSDAHAGRGYALVQLGRSREGVEAAERAVELAPREPDLLYNAACVYAQAAGKAQADRGVGDHQALTERYGQRSLELIRKALDRKPAVGRAPYWREVIAPDLALNPIRRLDGFVRLEAEYGRATP